MVGAWWAPPPVLSPPTPAPPMLKPQFPKPAEAGLVPCTACGTVPASTIYAKGSSECRLPAVRLCGTCGHLMVSTTGSDGRDMTKAEKARLPSHRYAAEIRAAQQEVVARLIG